MEEVSLVHSFRISLHKEDANIRCKSDFYPTKTRVKFFSNQNGKSAFFLPTRATTMTPRNTLSALHTRCIRTMDTSVIPETKAEWNVDVEWYNVTKRSVEQ